MMDAMRVLHSEGFVVSRPHDDDVLPEEEYEFVLSSLVDEVEVVIPEDYASFLIACGALYFEDAESNWPRPEPFFVGPAWAFLAGVHVYGAGTGIHPAFDVVARARAFNRTRRHRAIPIIKRVGDPNIICYGELGWFEATPGGDVACARQDLESLLVTELGAFRERAHRMRAARRREPALSPKDFYSALLRSD